ncbi:MFS transporter [Paramagnetospirillum magneticum]|uniref:Permease of the major facilitator superfamily n=1 Tax=Paramagnetospirillum magneticum (strain ATCC 700264 / AMB-1) TaxID=342108 RepID=Q2W277_PARM1|nr:MFS transporter [Paramagnetospirillum magneticum]BAE52048.1 Permease of the major facilitator superfamily [Paramagnetospirillum magneticum AMB-1]
MMTVMTDTHPSPKRRPWGHALRHPGYRLFFCGQAVSLMGSWMQMVAQSWLVYRLTGSAEMLGLVAFVGQIPVFIFGLLGGAVADRVPRRRLILMTQGAFLLQAAGLAALTLAGWVQIWHVLALAVLFGIINAVDIPARQAFTVDLVGKEDLGSAVALDASIFNAARLVAPALAGALVAALGEGWCFALNAVSFLGVIIALAVMAEPASATGGPAGESMLARVREGIAFVAGHGPILALMAMLGLSGLMGMSFSVLMPVFADRVLAGGPEMLGLLMSAAGAGALAASLAVAGPMQGASRGRVAWGLCAFGVALVAFALSRWGMLSMGLLALAGMALVAHNTASQILVQMLVPDAFRARTMALYSMTFMVATPSGSLLAGLLSERIGPQPTVALGGVACILGALAYRRWAP